jgi:hypothetical protein
MNSPITRAILPLLCFSISAQAQWSSDPAVNLAIADAASDQGQSKIAPTADGGCYVSWFDGIGTGWDVRLQRLDAGGNEQWAHGGVLVADRSFSSTQDYGLDVDSAGNAILTYRVSGGTGEQIAASSVAPDGTLRWGAGGVMLTNTSDFVAAPRICGTSDGDAVVAWTQNATTRLQRLDTNGAADWAADVVMTPAVGTYSASDIQDSGTDAILAIVHQNGTQFFSPKLLEAQKFDSTGTALWGALPVSIMNAGSLQFGNFPSFVTDGTGGAVSAWYTSSPLQCYAQHVLANGTQAFPQNGAAGATTANQLRTSPSVAYDAGSGSTYMFWTENDSNQAQRGVSGQKFDAAGARQWTDAGVTVVPLQAGEFSFVQTVLSGSNVFTFWDESPSFGNDVIRGARVTPAGSIDIAPFDVASTPSEKGRLGAVAGSAGEVLLSWSDKRTDDGDIYGQNVLSDGSLGVDPVVSYCFGVGCPCVNDDPSAGCLNSGGTGALLEAQGSSSVGSDDMTMTVAGAKPTQPGVLFSGINQLAPSPFRDGLFCTSGKSIRLGVRFASASGGATWGPGIAGLGGFTPGTVRHFQVWYRDPGGTCGTGSNLSNALTVTYRQ